MPTKRVVRARHDGDEPQPADRRARAPPPPSCRTTRAISAPSPSVDRERHHPADVERIAEDPAEPAERVERQRRVVVDDQRVGRRIERARRPSRRRRDRRSSPRSARSRSESRRATPATPEVEREQREQRDLRPRVEAAPAAPSSRIIPQARRARASTSAVIRHGALAADDRRSGRAPCGPVRPGSLPTKMPTSGTPSAAARCSSPVSTPTTNGAPAISARDLVERPALRHARARQRRRRCASLRCALGLGAPRQQHFEAARRERARRARSSAPPATPCRLARWRAAGPHRASRGRAGERGAIEPEIDDALGRVAERAAGQHAVARRSHAGRAIDPVAHVVEARRRAARGCCAGRSRGGGRARAWRSRAVRSRPWVSMTAS